MRRISLSVIALLVLGIATPCALLLTAPFQDAPSWWQAILSGVAVLATALFWHIDRTQTRAESTVRDDRERQLRAELEARYFSEREERILTEKEEVAAAGRSAAILILDDVLVLDSWVRQLIRDNRGPDHVLHIDSHNYPLVSSAPLLETLKEVGGHLHQMGPGSLYLQRAVFRYRQMVQLLSGAHDPRNPV